MKRNHAQLRAEAHQRQRIILTSLMQEVWLPIFLDLDVDITLRQLRGVIVLASHAQLSVRQFAEALHLGRAAASALVAHLLQDRLVERERDQADHRKVVLSLSQKGEALFAQLLQGRAERDPLPAWLEKLETHDLQALTQGLRALSCLAQPDLERPNDRQTTEVDA